jgi:hypothetical protein
VALNQTNRNREISKKNAGSAKRQRSISNLRAVKVAGTGIPCNRGNQARHRHGCPQNRRRAPPPPHLRSRTDPALWTTERRTPKADSSNGCDYSSGGRRRVGRGGIGRLRLRAGERRGGGGFCLARGGKETWRRGERWWRPPPPEGEARIPFDLPVAASSDVADENGSRRFRPSL